ncbi:MAG: ATP-binding cassette domain-containing protein [Nitrospiraceae bacterium]|nr:ATP-binding cassette domain-containing protein [Nitrospiraceae bacterium]
MPIGLRISDITRGYNSSPVIDNCSYTFQAGSVYAIMGPNGCGKSTLLRIFGLLESPSKGNLTYYSGNSELAQDMKLRRMITLLLPDIGLFNTTVLKNVEYGLKIRGYNKKRIHDAAQEAIELVGLTHKMNQNALLLSSGQKRRLGIARALVIKPSLLLLDEPTSAIDVENTEIVESAILRIKQERSSTIILSTHERAQADRLADRLLMVENKRLVEV